MGSLCAPLVGEEADLRCVGEDQIEGGVVVLDREELCVALQVFRQLPLLLLNGFDTSPRAAEYVHGRLGDRKTTARRHDIRWALQNFLPSRVVLRTPAISARSSSCDPTEREASHMTMLLYPVIFC